MAIWAIGDVHGCIRELEELFNKIDKKRDKTDQIVFVGDLIHKGPNQIEVLKFVESLQTSPLVTVIMGNHEEKQLRWCRKTKAEQEKMKTTLDYLDFVKPENKELLERVMTNAPILALREGFAFVHGGVRTNHINQFYTSFGTPSLTFDKVLQEIPLYEWNKSQTLSFWKEMVYLRYVRKHKLDLGHKTSFYYTMVPLGQEKDDDQYWAEVYDGNGMPTVIFGHQPFQQVTKFPKAIGIDTGCVFGNTLTAIRLEHDVHSFTIEVKAKQQYAEPYVKNE